MRVVLASDSYAPVLDGVAVCVSHYARALRESGDDCIVIAPHSGRDPVSRGRLRALRAAAGVAATRGRSGEAKPAADDPADPPESVRLDPLPIHFAAVSLPGIPSVDVTFHRELRSELRRMGGPDIVHTHTPFAAGSEARRIARHFRCQLVGTFHSKYRADIEAAGMHSAGRDLLPARIASFYRSCDEVWAPNAATAETLREYGYRGAVRVMPNGTEFSAVGDAERQVLRAACDRWLEAPAGIPMLLFVGQHRWEKNIGVILEALAILKAGGARFHMIFAGSGRDDREIRQSADELGLDPVVTFLGRVSERRRLRQLYARADIFVFPSVYDNAPLVIREAAAFACPSVLAAGASAASDTVDGVDAVHADPTGPALARTLVELFADSERVRRLGAAARERLSAPWGEVVAGARRRYAELAAALK